jgi:DNA-binding transcriptional ArsR family regulator
MSIDTDLLSGSLRVLAEPVRWRIVELLATEELCVCHLVEMLDASQSLISHHLRVLRDAGLVDADRFRYWTYYRLRPAALLALAHRLGELAEEAPVAGGRRRPCC